MYAQGVSVNFKDIDFNELYVKQKQKTSFKSKGVEQWNKKALHMNESVHQSIYNKEFLDAINTDECESVLDVGCGVGNLSLKLAARLNTVFSLDFSPLMLEQLVQNAKELDLSNIHTINKSWYDSWDEVSAVDMVIASRSMEVKDMKLALEKLNQKANKRVYLTYKVGGSFLDDNILKVLNKEIVKKPDYIYIVNILYQMDITANVQFLKSEGRTSMYDDAESFIQSVSWSLGKLTQEEVVQLKEYFSELKPEEKEKNKYIYWALISWEK
ncbi:class I SAM-dependent methyltransferase [Arcobacter sp. HD9-500m-PIT-SAG02]|nr:class I SAM-dependent methyltransferase [Arcobacter sp. HD9-500m-PIT-SAG02]